MNHNMKTMLSTAGKLNTAATYLGQALASAHALVGFKLRLLASRQ